MGRVGPLVAARMVTALLTLSIPMVLARVLPLDAYGTYYQLFLIAVTLSHVLPFGVAQSLYYFLPRTQERRPFLGQTLLYMTCAGAVGAVAVALGLPLLARAFDNPQLLAFRPELALYTLLLVGAYPLEIALTSQGRTKHSAVVYLVSDTLRAGVMVVPALLGWGLHGLMWGSVALAAVRYAAAWPVVLAGSKGALVDGARWREQLAYAAPFGAAMLLNMPQQQAHLFVVASAVAPAAYALYRVGCFQLPVVDLLYTPVSEVLMVKLGELERDGRAAEGVCAFREAAGKLAYVFLPFSAFLFAAAPEFIGALFGPKFLPAVPVFRVAVLGIGLAVLPMDGVLRARGFTRSIFASYLTKAAATVPLVYFGVRHFGMMGGVASWLAAELVGKATLLVRVPAALSAPGQRLGVRHVLPWGALARAGASALAAGALVFAVRAATRHVWDGLPEGLVWRALPLAAAGLLFAVGYVAGLLALGVRPLALLTALRRRRAAARPAHGATA